MILPGYFPPLRNFKKWDKFSISKFLFSIPQEPLDQNSSLTPLRNNN